MNNLYFDYIQERLGISSISDDYSFITFKALGDECHIYDAYVSKEKRRSGSAWNLMEKVEEYAKGKGCKYLSCTASSATLNATDSLRAILAVGFKIHSSGPNCMVFTKEL